MLNSTSLAICWKNVTFFVSVCNTGHKNKNFASLSYILKTINTLSDSIMIKGILLKFVLS